ncbi:hypothetical protein M0D69_02655 [Caballeronia sp. SEWSISQ10-4 2]|uniref:hypothetical protein n=1 Tax=Caballeronia sp. SEWSISQ10-4 2 TaxID=2937438 RepID=UPI00264E6AC2|nr:hypothetical protein [Caballeronia sp. SEWSISQ10-4 2]MDN7176938.1 hypothetical protein [Caballeronia sp. SEWSISQ10-4 2]
MNEFVKEVLTEIVAGVRGAQDAEGGAFIVPSGDGGHKYADHDRFSSSARIKSTVVDFDIALTVEESGKTVGGGQIKVRGIGARVKGERSSKDATVSRAICHSDSVTRESRRVAQSA